MSAREYLTLIGMDYDKLVSDLRELFRFTYHPSTKNGIDAMLNTYVEQKRDLIELFRKHPNYNGNLQVVIQMDLSRPIEKYTVMGTLDNFLDRMQAATKVIKNENENGQTVNSIIKDGIKEQPKIIKADDLLELKLPTIDLSGFNSEGNYIPTVSKYRKLESFVSKFYYYPYETLNEEMVENIHNIFPELKIVVGMKTSRAFNKLFADLKINDKDYQKIYPAYADSITSTIIKRNFILSLNPLDYFKMSFGNNWSSCHTIDKRNRRRTGGSTYSGMNCGGTMSYLLDGVTIITYITENGSDTVHPEVCDKIYRNVFCYKNNVLLQSRVYPQSNDGALDLYKALRLEMQKQMSIMLGVDYICEGNGHDTWINKGKSSDSNNRRYYVTDGCHYPDYTYSDWGGNISVIRNAEILETPMTIGHAGVDIVSGEKYTSKGWLTYYENDMCYDEKED